MTAPTLRDSIRAALGDEYDVERELTGGMSCVFVATDRALARKVVVKVLNPQLAASVSVERFKREIQTVASLQHPHIVPVLSTGNADGLPYFVMPYVDGESLAQRLTTGHLSVRDTVAILKDVARALAFAHERGIVHRDIKPGNILLSGGSATVTDFGVAKALSSSRRTSQEHATSWGLTTAGSTLGTLLYMAPEQAAADPDIDGRADIYSLALTAYEALVGEPPFAGLSARAMLAARMSGKVPSLAVRRPDVPRKLDELISKCLSPDPADRPSSAQELVDALEAPDVLSGEFASIKRPHRYRRIAIAALAAAALVAAYTTYEIKAPGRTLATLGTSRGSAHSAVGNGQVAVVPFVDLSSDAADDNIATGITNAVASSLTKSGKLQVVSPTAASAIVQELRSGSDKKKGVTGLVLEGTVQREGGRLRVTARLTNASDGVMRWADVYDRQNHNVFAVTDDIAAAIVASLARPTT